MPASTSPAPRTRSPSPADRRRLLEQVARNWRRDDVDVMDRYSPLIEVEVPGYSRSAPEAVA